MTYFVEFLKPNFGTLSFPKSSWNPKFPKQLALLNHHFVFRDKRNELGDDNDDDDGDKNVIVRLQMVKAYIRLREKVYSH